MQSSPPRSSREAFHFLIVFLIISFNLRMSFSAAEPLLVLLIRDLGLTISDSSLFALLPIVVLGIAAIISPRLTAFIRPRLLIVVSLVFALIGVVVRSYGGLPGLFIGTAAIGFGLGITGSVILGIVKEIFPGRSPAMMGAFTACVCLGTSVGAGASDPIAIALGGWQQGLLFWGLPLLIATLLWIAITYNKKGSSITYKPVHAPLRPLFYQRKAWMITFFYVTRVAASWLLIVWLASLMRQRGMPLVEAGFVLALAKAFQIPSALVAKHVSEWMGGDRLLLMITVPISILSAWGLLLGPLDYWLVFAISYGLSVGFIFTLGMVLIVQCAEDEAATIALSGMSQGIGFILGGGIAWVASFGMDCPDNHLVIFLIYALISIFGLYFAIQSTKAGIVSIIMPPIKEKIIS